MHRKLSINALSNLGKYLVQIVVLFLLTPFVIRSLGSADYGLWVVVLSLVGYSGLLEMGVQTSVIKLVAQYNGVGDARRLNQIVSVALLFFLSAGLLAACAVWFLAPLFLERLVSSASDRETVRLLLIVLGFDLLLLFPNYVFTGVVFGAQAYHRKNLLDIVCTLLNAVITYVMLLKGFGLIAVVTAKCLTDLLVVLNTYYLCRKACPGLELSHSHLVWDAVKELFVMGGKVFSSATMARLANNAEPLIIGGFLGTTWAAVYSIPKRLLDYVKEVSWALTTGFMPMFSELQAKSELESIRAVYFQYTRYIQLAVSPILAAILVYGIPFIRLWVGDEFADKGRYLVYLLAAAFFIEGLQPLAWRMLIGVGKVDFLVKVSAVGSLAYIAGSLLLVTVWGVNGIAFSALVVACINQALYFSNTSSYLEVSVPRLLLECQIWPSIAAAFYLIELLLFSFMKPPSSYLDIVAQVLTGVPLYLLAAYFFALGQTEREFMSTRLKAWCSAVFV